MKIQNDEEGLCWSPYLHDSIWGAQKGPEEWLSPCYRWGDWALERLSNVFTRSRQYMAPSEPEPTFHSLKPHTCNHYKMIRTSVQKLIALLPFRKREWDSKWRTRDLPLKRMITEQMFVISNAACFSVELWSNNQFLYLLSPWVRPNPSRQTCYIISLSICCEDGWLQPSILAPWSLLPPCLPRKGNFLYPAINHL